MGMGVVNTMIHMLIDVENDKVCFVLCFRFWMVTSNIEGCYPILYV
jgi:hypothetical protein